jgi:DNA polymerase III subunit delta'
VSWDRIQGHEAQVEAFTRAVRRGRLAHAYLFVGPEGVGKRTFAVELAKALLCEAPPADGRLQACDRCPACVQVEAGTHPDFFAVARPEERLEFPVELMRELCGRFALKSARGRGKVVVIDDADDLNEESANCFLKTLEEPPPRSVLILVGSSPDRQLPTIVSRCQVVRFAPLADAMMSDLLQAQGVDDAALRARLVRLGSGSPGQARALTDPELWDFWQSLVGGLTQPRPDTVKLSKAWLKFVEEAGKEAAAQRRRAALVLRLLVGFFADALAVSVGGSPRRSEPSERASLEAFAQRLGPDRLQELLERCLEGDGQIDRRVQLVLILEALLDALGQKMSA